MEARTICEDLDIDAFVNYKYEWDEAEGRVLEVEIATGVYVLGLDDILPQPEHRRSVPELLS